ncbi:hypothetical protein AgCh_024491 [Apium graveolens]
MFDLNADGDESFDGSNKEIALLIKKFHKFLTKRNASKRPMKSQFPNKDFKSNPSNESMTNSSKDVCFECRKKGHFKKDFYKLKSKKKTLLTWSGDDSDELIPPPKDAKVIGTGWVFNYDQTYALIAHLEVICILMAFPAHMKLTLYQIDVKRTFLNDHLKEEVYVKQPPGTFIHQGKYINDLLKRFTLEHFTPKATPMSTSVKLTKDEQDADYAGSQVDRKSTSGACEILVSLSSSSLTIHYAIDLIPQPQETVTKGQKSVAKGQTKAIAALFWGYNFKRYNRVFCNPGDTLFQPLVIRYRNMLLQHQWGCNRT